MLMLLLNVSRTKLDIGLLQTRTLMAVAAISQNGHLRLVKTSYPIEPTCSNMHNIDPSNLKNKINTHSSMEYHKVLGHSIIF